MTSARKDFLLLIALGDSYGMKYEFVPHAQDKTADDLFHGPHPKFTEYQTGHYTDDTQMSLANLELLMTNRTPDADAFIAQWLHFFKRDPHLGYSKYMWGVLSDSATPDDFRARLDPTRGATSGAAMRAGPFGLLEDVEEVKALTALQARITHNTETGTNAALAVALTVHFLHHGGTRDGLDDFLASHIGADWSAQASATDLNNGLTIVTQAMNAFKHAKSLSEVLLNAVNQQPACDTDTVCAIAMTMASRCKDIVNDLPAKLYDGLESGLYGKDYLKAIDEKAAKAFPPSAQYATRPRSAPSPACGRGPG